MTDFQARASYLADYAQQQRTQMAMEKEANYVIATGNDDPVGRLALAGKMLRSPTEWAGVVYAHICAVDPQVPVAAMDDAMLTSAVGNAINDLAATES